jgi:MarR family transcriptional regulator, lower aerobic nicotinate degradation pathway regulator
MERQRKTKKSSTGRARASKKAVESLRRPDNVVVNDVAPRSRAKSAEQHRADPVTSPVIVWSRLMKLTSLIGRPFFTRFAQKYEMSANDWRVLTTLASAPESASHELCQITGMHPMNVSRSVATLRKQGRVSERTDPDNRRRKILSLTQKGWDVYERGVPQVRELAQFLLSSMSPLEVEFFDRLVDLLIGRLEEANPESVWSAEDGENANEPSEA